MDPSFGARLRARREQQQVALADIAEQTKIKASLLAALERDDVSQWPSGIFRRSYVRTYARAIGLEPDAVVREFLEHHPDPADEGAVVLATALDGESARRRPPTRLRFLIASAIEALPVLRPSSLQSKAAVARPRDAAGGGADDYGPFLAAQPEPAMAAAHEWTTEDASASLSHAVDEQLQLPGVPTSAGTREAAASVSPRDELTALAALCARIARTSDPAELGPVLEGAASLLDALGVLLWMWDPHGSALRPVLGHGYPNDMLARLGGVSRDADNALAAAFRTSETRVVNGRAEETGAVVVPLITPTGCAGVLAFELRYGHEPGDAVKAFAAIIAAQLATLIAS